MEYKCALCDRIVIVVEKSTVEQIIHTFNDKSYCNECIEAVQFADMVSQPKKLIKRDENIKKSEIIQKKENISIYTYRCIKCKIETSGNNCTNCGTPSPFTKRKKIR